MRFKRAALTVSAGIIVMALVQPAAAEEIIADYAGTEPQPRSATSPTMTRCRDVIVRDGLGNVYTRTRRLRASSIRCRRARAVARRYLHGAEGNADPVSPFGFPCTPGGAGVTCRKDRWRIRWAWAASANAAKRGAAWPAAAAAQEVPAYTAD